MKSRKDKEGSSRVNVDEWRTYTVIFICNVCYYIYIFYHSNMIPLCLCVSKYFRKQGKTLCLSCIYVKFRIRTPFCILDFIFLDIFFNWKGSKRMDKEKKYRERQLAFYLFIYLFVFLGLLSGVRRSVKVSNSSVTNKPSPKQ